MGERLLLSISFDDIDSRFWGCTTHLAGLFLLEASRIPGVRLADYPLLIRLNPSIPWKTRGNAAVVLRLLVDGHDRALDLCDAAWSMALEYASPRLGEPVKKPGVACLAGPPWTRELRALYRRALVDVVVLDEALRMAGKVGAKGRGGRGLVGALSALAALAPGEPSTFELAAYRHPDLWGEPRCIDHEKAAAVEARLPACAFNNYDPASRRLTAAPGGPDPVLAGFRGTCPGSLSLYSEALCEEPHFWVLYRSNQHTDAHATPMGSVRPYKTGLLSVVIDGNPDIARGGHVYVKARSLERGERVVLAFYRETGPLNRAARLLMPGDHATVLASSRPYDFDGLPVLTVEKLVVERVAPHKARLAPRCPRCGHRMKSLGRGRGYACPRCGYRDPAASHVEVEIPRRLAPGIYTPGPGRLRHLTAPWPSPRYYTPEHLPEPRWEDVLSSNANPPVTDPPVSSGSHRGHS